MTETVTVWRIEHDCSTHHGPVQGCPDDTSLAYWDSVPEYGTNLEPPQRDPMLGKIFGEYYLTSARHDADQFIFGTLPHQFPRWWTHGNGDLIEKWVAACFEIAADKVVVGTNQVIFKREDATLLATTQCSYPR